MDDSSSSSHSWDAGKLFVGGISWETGDAELRAHFSKYGDVVETVSVRDRDTGNPRGFAFVLFSDHDAVERAIKDKNHVILDRSVEVRRARSRTGQHQNQTRGQSRSVTNTNTSSGHRNRVRSKKIFVGGLASEVNEGVFRAYFEKFGRITDVVVIYDNVTHRSRGFGFIEFQSEESVERVMKKGVHELNNKRVEVKVAVPKDGYSHRNAGSGDGAGYEARAGGGMGHGFGYYQGGVYPAHDPRYGMYPVYAPPPVYGYTYGPPVYGGGYANGAYGRVGYGAPFASPRGIWNGQGVGVPRQNSYPLPYAGATVYPGYYNGGYGGYVDMAGGGYYGMVSGNGKQNQVGSDVQETSTVEVLTSGVESLKLDSR